MNIGIALHCRMPLISSFTSTCLCSGVQEAIRQMRAAAAGEETDVFDIAGDVDMASMEQFWRRSTADMESRMASAWGDVMEGMARQSKRDLRLYAHSTGIVVVSFLEILVVRLCAYKDLRLRSVRRR